MFYANLIVNIK